MLIEAVFADRPTVGMPTQLAGRSFSRPGAGLGLGAVVATAAGKVLLCTAVAAASVGGVYATTDRIDVGTPPDSGEAVDAPVVVEVSVVDEVPDLAEPADMVEVPAADEVPVANEGPTVAEPAGAPTGVEAPETSSVESAPPSPDLVGCERGQAIAAEASSNGQERREAPDSDHDPCTRSEGRGPDSGADANNGQANGENGQANGDNGQASGNNGNGQANGNNGNGQANGDTGRGNAKSE